MEAPLPSLNEDAGEKGDFYVEPGCCLLCGVPEEIAPEIFHTGKDHCFIVRQPCSRYEIDRTIRAMWSSEVDCVRYGGRDAATLERLVRAGMIGQTDQGNATSAPVRLRNRVAFEMPYGTNLTNVDQVATAFRADMRAKGNKVLPALLGRRSVWVSWFRNRFHLVQFADAGQGRIVARLRWTMAVQGLAWLVDDWLRAQLVENICWEAIGDPSSASPAPM